MNKPQCGLHAETVVNIETCVGRETVRHSAWEHPVNAMSEEDGASKRSLKIVAFAEGKIRNFKRVFDSRDDPRLVS